MRELVRFLERREEARRPRTRASAIAALVTYVLLSLGGFTMLIPLAWMVSTSLKLPGAVFTIPPEWIPRRQVRQFVLGEERPIFEVYINGRLRRVALLEHKRDLSRVVPVDEVFRRKRGDGAGEGKLEINEFVVKRKELKPVKEIHLEWSNYYKAWTAVEIDHYLINFQLGKRHIRWLHITHGFVMFYINSVLVAVVVTFGQVFTSSLAGYAFARLNFPARDKIFLGYLATMMIPYTVIMIPNFILMRSLRLIDTYWALMLPPLFSAYGTFMLRQFFMGIPQELEDAARIDGCSKFGVYLNVILPLSKPALATLATFTFIGSWNSFMWPLIVTNRPEMKTLPIGIAHFQGLYNTEWTLLMAASVIVIAPVILVFVFNQRFFQQGIHLAGLGGR